MDETHVHQPCDFLILSLSRLHLQTLIVHLVHIPRRRHIVQNVILQIDDGFQIVRHLLVLLDVANHFRRFGPFGEIDESGALDDRGYAVLDESEIGEIDTWNAC